MTTAPARIRRSGGDLSRFAWRVAVWTGLLALVLVLCVSVLVPRLTGATPYTVLTGSMQPTYPPGTLVVVEPVAIDEVAVGDVITYQLESGRAAVVTHRVVSVGSGMSGTGERVVRTRGDANDTIDREPVREVQLKGRVWYAVPHLGRVGTWFSGSTREVLTVGAAGVLGLYAAAMFVAALAERRSRTKSDQTNSDRRKRGGVHAS